MPIFLPVTDNCPSWISGRVARRWVGRQTQWWPRHKAIYFSWFGPELFCLLLGPPGFNCWFSSAPVFQWCCSTPQGSPGVGRNTFLSSPHLCFIIVFNCDLFVSRDFTWWSIDELENLHADRTTVCFEPWWKLRARLGACKTGLSPPVFLYWPFQGGTSVVVPYCSCCLCLYFGSSIMLVTYFVNFR